MNPEKLKSIDLESITIESDCFGLFVECDTRNQIHEVKKQFLDNQKLRIRLEKYLKSLEGIEGIDEIELTDDLQKILRGKK